MYQAQAWDDLRDRFLRAGEGPLIGAVQAVAFPVTFPIARYALTTCALELTLATSTHTAGECGQGAKEAQTLFFHLEINSFCSYSSHFKLTEDRVPAAQMNGVIRNC